MFYTVTRITKKKRFSGEKKNPPKLEFDIEMVPSHLNDYHIQRKE